MKKLERRWTVVAFKHPYMEHSVYYRKGIVHLDRAVKTAENKGANLMSIRGFDIEADYGPKIKPQKGQGLLEHIEHVPAKL
jgi:hypothetical protein